MFVETLHGSEINATRFSRKSSALSSPLLVRIAIPHFGLVAFAGIRKSGKYFGSSQLFVQGKADLSNA